MGVQHRVILCRNSDLGGKLTEISVSVLIQTLQSAVSADAITLYTTDKPILIHFNFYRAMLSIRGTSHGLVSVCLSVRHSQVSVLSKRLNESSSFLACELPSTRPTLC